MDTGTKKSETNDPWSIAGCASPLFIYATVQAAQPKKERKNKKKKHKTKSGCTMKRQPRINFNDSESNWNCFKRNPTRLQSS
jgi:hypothetical protein